MRIIVDMNLSPRWVGLLTEAGFEAAHWLDLGPSDASDAQIMAFARTHEYVVLTHDLDFSAILSATHAQRPSVVQVRSDDVSPQAIGNRVVAALRQMASELGEGALLTIDVARTRLRVLPFNPSG